MTEKFGEFMPLPDGFGDLLEAFVSRLSPTQRMALDVATVVAGMEAYEAKARAEDMEAQAIVGRQEALILSKAFDDGVIDGKNERWRTVQTDSLLAVHADYMQLKERAAEARMAYMSAKVSSGFMNNMFKIAMEALRLEVQRAKPE